MAGINGQIILSTCEGRPCWVDGRRAIFHRWTDSARPVKANGAENDESAERFQKYSVHALVEYEDGTVEREWPSKIRFADGGQFEQFDWETMEKKRDELPFTFEEITPEPEQTGEPAEDCQEVNEAEVWSKCESCAHATENVEFCSAAEYNCKACTVRGCRCKRCDNFNKWEPKEGST